MGIDVGVPAAEACRQEVGKLHVVTEEADVQPCGKMGRVRRADTYEYLMP